MFERIFENSDQARRSKLAAKPVGPTNLRQQPFLKRQCELSQNDFLCLSRILDPTRKEIDRTWSTLSNTLEDGDFMHQFAMIERGLVDVTDPQGEKSVDKERGPQLEIRVSDDGRLRIDGKKSPSIGVEPSAQEATNQFPLPLVAHCRVLGQRAQK
ncbi:hypothetical protein K458DRAFT_383437 [Lentithecium fluviatile CBS 122367]|uniref:Uncharacterized protein n=1 Tax=Lentithecium fluviatile CBS 122367 TaxID=1168545 RepID=A0A6G1JJJ0_9PLEO|nr:hypothetical protein K458DRAFT_383437 [Lentithecium fluviatile CBS 122367]